MHAARRNFQAVWLSLFSTSLGLMAFLPVLALYVADRFGFEDSREIALWAGVIYGAGPLAAAFMGPVWGAIGDRYGKRHMAVRANAAIAVTTALMPLMPSPQWLLAMRVLQGVFAGYVAPAMALVSSHLPSYVHGRIIARLQVAMALGMFGGPYLGAEITSWFGRSALFWVASCMSALSAVNLWLSTVEAKADPDKRRESFFADFRRGCAELLGNRVFAVLLVLLLLLRLGQNMLEPLLSLFVQDLGPQALLLRMSSTRDLALDRTIAVAFGVLAIAQWFFTPWWGRQADRRGPLRSLVVVSFGLCVLQAAMTMVASVDAFLLLRSAIACLMAGSMTLAYASVSKRVGDARRTLAFALVQSCIQLGHALGPMIGAVVAQASDRTDYRRAFGVAALLCGMAGTGMVLLRRAERARA